MFNNCSINVNIIDDKYNYYKISIVINLLNNASIIDTFNNNSILCIVLLCNFY